MGCTLAALVACFSWSGLYLDSGVVATDVGIKTMYIVDSAAAVVIDGNFSEVRSRQISRGEITQNPYGRIALGYELPLSSSFLARLELAHVSSLATDGDRGVNSIALNVRWYPFRR